MRTFFSCLALLFVTTAAPVAARADTYAYQFTSTDPIDLTFSFSELHFLQALR